jgi:hypothetical protein
VFFKALVVAVAVYEQGMQRCSHTPICFKTSRIQPVAGFI